MQNGLCNWTVLLLEKRKSNFINRYSKLNSTYISLDL
jgi:hypothetical protein